MAEKPTGPMFDTAENVATLDTLDGKPLCVADDGGIPQLQRGEGDVHNREGRLCDAQAPQGQPSWRRLELHDEGVAS